MTNLRRAEILRDTAISEEEALKMEVRMSGIFLGVLSVASALAAWMCLSEPLGYLFLVPLAIAVSSLLSRRQVIKEDLSFASRRADVLKKRVEGRRA